MKKIRLYTSLTCFSLLVTFVCLIPIPHFVWADFAVRPQNSHELVTTLSGTLKHVDVANGSQVSAGQPVAVLENDELLLDLQRLEGQLAKANKELSELQRRTSTLITSGDRIVEIASQIAALEKQIELKRDQCSELTICANRDGIVFASHNKVAVSYTHLTLPTICSV